MARGTSFEAQLVDRQIGISPARIPRQFRQHFGHRRSTGRFVFCIQLMHCGASNRNVDTPGLDLPDTFRSKLLRRQTEQRTGTHGHGASVAGCSTGSQSDGQGEAESSDVIPHLVRQLASFTSCSMVSK